MILRHNDRKTYFLNDILSVVDGFGIPSTANILLSSYVLLLLCLKNMSLKEYVSLSLCLQNILSYLCL